MATTVSRVAVRKRSKKSIAPWSSRWGEFIGLLVASLVVLAGLWLTYQAKTTNPERTAFADAEERLKSGQLANLNTLTRAADLLPFLSIYDSEADKNFAAEKIYTQAARAGHQLQNVGELRKLSVSREEIDSNPQLSSFKKRLAAIRLEEAGLTPPQPNVNEQRMPLLTSKQLGQLKSSFIVRSPQELRAALLLWVALSVLVFYAIHLAWRFIGFNGDQLMLPLIHLLSGLGLILMLTLRDPLRDMLSFKDFAMGLLGGCLLLFLASVLNFERLFGKLTMLPLLIALGLSGLLILFGSGPGTSDAKVNLFGLQPVEFIRIFVALFLAGYFAEHWEFLRELKQRGGGGLFNILSRLNAPRLVYFLPVVIAMSAVLGFFFLQKDLGPALVMGCTFLALYAVARKRPILVALGLTMLVVGVWVGYKLVWPLTVYQRIRIWMDVWDNGLRNGDQIAQAWWALATGSVTGTGLGLGDPSLIPAGHTDLVLATLGEELGFVGLATVIVLYAILTVRGLRIALRAQSDYTFFLALGLVSLNAFQIALITGGMLGLLPLSGVVSPFMSYGKSSMLANCLIFGALCSISSRPANDKVKEQFGVPVKHLSTLLSVICIVLLLKAAYVQVWRADDNVLAPVLTKQADNIYRYLYNPRLTDAARRLPRGSIYDRYGLPLATSDWNELEKYRHQYEDLGINIDVACDRSESRHYPFGPILFHILGDIRTHDNWGASNSNYIERDDAGELQGFSDNAERVVKTVVELDARTREVSSREVAVLRRDFHALLPLLRYRYRPTQTDVQNLLGRERNVRLSIDIRLQLRAAEVLKRQLLEQKLEKGAAVVLDAGTGDLLASVSYPWPSERQRKGAEPVSRDATDNDVDLEEEYLDRARYGTYPPGSTFKIVTAIAALRKDPQLANKTFECIPLADGRVGNYIKGSSRPVRDDKGDAAHGSVQMEKGIIESCNAYFAQLGTYEIGASSLWQTARLFEIQVANPDSPDQLSSSLSQASYGQGQVVATPFQMARVAATIADNGRMPYGRWVLDDNDRRHREPAYILSPELTSIIARAMRGVVEHGTATSLRQILPPIAGKTGTAEIQGDASHSWFIGFAPSGTGKRIAFAVVIENGGYGGKAAAPLAGEIVKISQALGLTQVSAR
jgi:cell division protein FtsI/penicillin-binding protein 2/cell division protein FtsW (lipid II flippase)